MNRTDPHRKGAIIPAEYTHVMFYNLSTQQDGWPIPSYRVNCEKDGGEHSADGSCCVVGLKNIGAKMASYGHTGTCTACGSHFLYGEVWKHEPTGEHIHVGHICAEKYGLIADRTAHELEAGRRAATAAARFERDRKAVERKEFLAEYPGLEEALETDHHIVDDIKRRFVQWCNLSDKQIALVMKLHKEATEKTEEPEEKHVPAPEGKQTFTGVVVSKKAHDNAYGCTIKITVKMTTPEGVWLAWGTCPSSLLYHSQEEQGCDVGDTVEIKATVKRSDSDAHFSFFKRPRGRVVEKASQ